MSQLELRGIKVPLTLHFSLELYRIPILTVPPVGSFEFQLPFSYQCALCFKFDLKYKDDNLLFLVRTLLG